MVQAELLLSLIQSDAGHAFADSSVGWDRSSQVCDWYGIFCDGEGHVTSISLTGVDLDATIPVELGMLSTLERLVLSNVHLHGEIPEELAGLARLREIDLSFNSLEGNLPTFTSPYLEMQSFAHNELGGTISSKIGFGMEKLTMLDLRFNFFTGTIPTFESSLLSRLRNIDLSYNELSGIIPVSLAEFPDLKWLYLNNNALSGAIPAMLARPDSVLEELHLQSNWITGTLPSTLATLGDLRELFVDDNLITGTIPTELCDKNLNDAYFTDDMRIEQQASNTEDGSVAPLSGGSRRRELQTDNIVRDSCSSIACPAGTKSINPDVPGVFPCWPCPHNDPSNSYIGAHECHEISETSVLQTLFDATKGSGWKSSIRTSWEDDNVEVCDRVGISCDDSGSVAKISLEQAGLAGMIPSMIGSLSHLVELDLSDNSISGTIPESLSLIPLQTLDLSNNRLVGTVPKSLCSMPGLNGNGRDDIFSCDVVACPVFTFNAKGFADPGMGGDHCMPCGSASAAGLGRTVCIEAPTPAPIVAPTPEAVDDMKWLDALLITLVVMAFIGAIVFAWKRSVWFRSFIQSRYSRATPQNNKDEAVVEPVEQHFTVSEEGLEYSAPIRNEWVSERVENKKMWLENPQVV